MSEPLFEEQIVLAGHAGARSRLPADGRRSRSRPRRIELLLPAPGTAFRGRDRRRHQAAGVRLRPLIEVDGVRLLASLAFDGHGPALLPSTAVPAFLRSRVRLVTVDGMARRHVGLATRGRGLPSAPARAVISVLRERGVESGAASKRPAACLGEGSHLGRGLPEGRRSPERLKNPLGAPDSCSRFGEFTRFHVESQLGHSWTLYCCGRRASDERRVGLRSEYGPVLGRDKRDRSTACTRLLPAHPPGDGARAGDASCRQGSVSEWPPESLSASERSPVRRRRARAGTRRRPRRHRARIRSRGTASAEVASPAPESASAWASEASVRSCTVRPPSKGRTDTRRSRFRQAP